jgi:hypothetical protein
LISCKYGYAVPEKFQVAINTVTSQIEKKQTNLFLPGAFYQKSETNTHLVASNRINGGKNDEN